MLSMAPPDRWRRPMEEVRPMVPLGEEIFYEPSFKLVICKLHGHGVRPSEAAIKRHLRGHGHRSRGHALARVLNALAGLPLASLIELHDVQAAEFSNAESPAQPIPYLKVLKGWNCVPCQGSFLTTSLELVQRHAAAVHGRTRGGAALWDDCLLQTLFSETKDRRYFCVAAQHQTEAQLCGILQDDKQTEQDPQEHGGTRRAIGFATVSTIGESCHRQIYSSRRDTSTPDGSQGSHVSNLPKSLAPEQPNMPRAIVPRHPFTSIAEKYVPLSGQRIDLLLKSAAFRSASMPIFDSSHIDTSIKMQDVFPECEESGVWANALLYSTVQLLNRGAPTVEGQLLQRKTIQLMNGKLSFPDETLCSAAVGAIMVLKATAFKTNDLMAHKMHTEGLIKVLDYVAKTGSSLTPSARKAIFWLDLEAAAYVHSERQMSHLDRPPVFWRREMRPEIANFLPAGFLRHRDALPYGLPECIADLEEFQLHVREDLAAQIPRSNRYAQLEPMQASIESRLSFQARACRQVGVLAEAVRLALYICTYCSWMDTWNVGLLPCRLAAEIFDLIESISSPNSVNSDNLWQTRLDLILWLTFISSSAAELDEGQVEDIKARRNSLLSFVSRKLPSLTQSKPVDLKLSLHAALTSFVYVDGWLERRGSILTWQELELVVNGDIP